jgi:rhamnogalacturonyl hydrolase YesR
MLNQQPEPATSLYLCKRWSGEWITAFAPGEASRFLVQFGKANQIYWYFGIGMAALGKLYLSTGERKWLEFAIRIFDLAKRCSPEVYQSLTSAKVGWGASVIYRITGEKRFEDITLQVGKFLLDTQTEEGIWIRRPQYNSIKDQPMPNSLDTTLERCLWLYEMARGVERGSE